MTWFALALIGVGYGLWNKDAGAGTYALGLSLLIQLMIRDSWHNYAKLKGLLK